MGDNNSKPDYPFHNEKITESHDVVGEGNGRYNTKFNYSNANSALHPNEDLIRGLIKENRIKNDKIKLERMSKETEIRKRLEEQKYNERFIREKERQLKEESEAVRRQNVLLKKEHEITKQEFKTENMMKKSSFDRRSPKLVSNKPFEDGVKETYIQKQNELMEDRRCIEKQLLGNLFVKKTPKPLTQRFNGHSKHRTENKETVPDMRPLKIEHESKIEEQMSGKFKKNKNKQRNINLKKTNAEHNIKRNAQSNGTRYSPFQSQTLVHMNPQSNQNNAVINNEIQLNQHQATLPAVTQNHYYTQPPPAYSTHSFHIFNTTTTDSLVAINYPQQLPVYKLPPPSYSSTPQNYRKKSNNGDWLAKTKTKVNGDQQHDNKFAKGNRNKQRFDTYGAQKLRNKK